MSYSLAHLGSNIKISNAGSLGNVGIGTDASTSYKLHISCNLGELTNDVFPLKLSAGSASTVTGKGTFLGLGTENLSYAKCAIGHIRNSAKNDRGDIVFLNRGSADDVGCDTTNEIMRITNSNVGILKSNPSSSYALDVGGAINATAINVNGQAFVGGGGGGTYTADQWGSNLNTLFTTSNVVIGSNVSGGDKLEVYNGDIDVVNGNMKKTLQNRTVNRIFKPDIWYQFNDTVTNNGILYNSGYNDLNFNLTMTASATPTITKVTGYSSSYAYPNAYQFNTVNNGTDNIKTTASANIQSLLNKIYTTTAFSINFIFYTNARNPFTIFRTSGTVSGTTYNFILVTYDSGAETIKFGVNYNFGSTLEIASSISINTYYNVQCICAYSTSTQIMTLNLNVFQYGGSVTTATPETQSSASTKFNGFNSTLTAGALELGSGTTSTAVLIQDFRFFTYALSASELSALRTGPAFWTDSNTNLIENYAIERWKDSSTYNQANGTNFIYYTDGNVGIGTVTPNYNLDVQGIIRCTSSIITQTMIVQNGNVGIGTDYAKTNLHLHNRDIAKDVRIMLTDATTTANFDDGFHIAKDTSSQGLIWNYENTDIVFGTNNTERARILANGQLMISTAGTYGITWGGSGTFIGRSAANNSISSSDNAGDLVLRSAGALQLVGGSTNNSEGWGLHIDLNNNVSVGSSTSKFYTYNDIIINTNNTNGIAWNFNNFSYIGRSYTNGDILSDVTAGDFIIRSNGTIVFAGGAADNTKGWGVFIDPSNNITTRAGIYLRNSATPSSTNNWGFYVANNYDLQVVYNGSGKGYFDRNSENTKVQNLNFTGQHRTFSLDKSLYKNEHIGYIVSSKGKYKEISSKYHISNIKQNIVVNDALPYVCLTTKAYDKSVFGVISDRLEGEYDENDPENRKYFSGIFVSQYKKDVGDDRLIVNGCGEGSVWVSDYNGSLENGDYIVSSPIPGIGMRQDDDLLHNYTVAKITMDCDFNPQYIPVQIIKQVQYTINSSNIGTSNMIDENGDLVYEYQLDNSSNIVYDYEYDMKYIKLDGTIVTKDYYDVNCEIEKIYKMAFVGCSYKCS